MAKIIGINNDIVTVEFDIKEKRDYLRDNFLYDVKIGDEVILRNDGKFILPSKDNKKIKLINYILISILIISGIFIIYKCALNCYQTGYEVDFSGCS